MGKKNPINHVEWRTREEARLRHFYSNLFKWKFKDEDGGYTLVDFGNKDSAGGIFRIPKDAPTTPTGITPYITVEDLAAVEAKIQELGGKVVMSKQEVAEHGWFTTFTDPDGNAMAIWQEMPKKEKKRQAKKARKSAKKAEKNAYSKKAEKLEGLR
jgi:predicted enzyme related to lactoylglutathione lyase